MKLQGGGGRRCELQDVPGDAKQLSRRLKPGNFVLTYFICLLLCLSVTAAPQSFQGFSVTAREKDLGRDLGAEHSAAPTLRTVRPPKGARGWPGGTGVSGLGPAGQLWERRLHSQMRGDWCWGGLREGEA